MALEHALADNERYQQALQYQDATRLTLDVLEGKAAALRFAQRERDLNLRERELHGVV